MAEETPTRRRALSEPAQCPEGTQDLYGVPMRMWLVLRDAAQYVFSSYGYDPVETPYIERLDVFTHGIGDDTDVVQKEMFRVLSAENFARVLKEGSEENLRLSRRLALRPEGTAGFVRAAIQNNWYSQGSSPVKVYYAGPMFRGERPAKGRLREFHQIGAEIIGTNDPIADVELIVMLHRLFISMLGFPRESLTLRLNSIGDETCRLAYKKVLRAYLAQHEAELCEDCKARYENNPLRTFDCKNEQCKKIMGDAPLITDYLCDDCKQHFSEVKRLLNDLDVHFEEDPTLVRGLDYYTQTVFELICEAGTGAQNALAGGGSYGGLFELEGGKPTPGAGFALGFERILLAMQALDLYPEEDIAPFYYVATTDPKYKQHAFEIALKLRDLGLRTELDYQERSLKSQMKAAGKLGVINTFILGDDEIKNGTITIRDMQTHEQISVNEEQYFESLAQEVYEDFISEDEDEDKGEDEA